ncbi:MAG: ABC transporter substrate-binding protein, partial [Bacillota bacterium]
VIVGYWGGGLPTMNSVTAPAKVLTLLTTQANYDPIVMPYTAIGPDNAYCSLSQIKAILKAFPETKKIGISSSDPYYQNVFDSGRILPFFKEILTENGIGYFEDLYPWETTDYTQHVEKLKQAGVDTIYSFGAPEQVAMTKKAIYEAGYKTNFATSGTIPDLDAFIDIAGYEAAQGGLHTFYFPWELKNIKVAPEAVEMALKIRDKHKELYNEEMTYDGAFAYGLNQMQMYIQAAQKAGTTDPDELMKVIDGGTFDLFLGTTTLGGKETYGRAVFGAFPGAMGKLEGRKLVYASDEPGEMIP